MEHSRNLLNNLSLNQKKSVFRIATELVKADNQIHRNEVALLDDLQSRIQLSQEELDATHYLSLQEAVASLSVLTSETKTTVLSVFEEIVRVDNDVDFGENLMLSALKLVLRDDSSAWSGIISVGPPAPVFCINAIYMLYFKGSDGIIFRI